MQEYVCGYVQMYARANAQDSIREYQTVHLRVSNDRITNTSSSTGRTWCLEELLCSGIQQSELSRQAWVRGIYKPTFPLLEQWCG